MSRRGGDDDDPWTNFFVRFKQNVDAHIATALQGTIGLPSEVSRSINAQWVHPPTRDNEAATATTTTATTSTAGGSGSNSETTSSSVIVGDGSSTSLSASAPSPESSHIQESFSSLSPMRALFDATEFTESIYQVMWMSFLVDSPYSPLRLQGMPQPSPRDLPEGADPSLFGFEDAFEDLLSVTSGQGLLDIHARHATKKEWRDSFPAGLPLILWVHTLCRQGLWDGWESRPDVFKAPVSERWRRWLAEQDDPFHKGHQGASTDENDRAVTQSSASSKEISETEEDAYNAVERRRRRQQIDDHWDEMRKAFDERREHDRRPFPSDSLSARRQTPGESLPEGWRVDETVKERKDDNGNTSVTRTRVTYDNEGREVGRQTDTQSQWSSSWSWSSSPDGSSKDPEPRRTRSHQEDDDEKKGWFWK